ncbi:metal-dependent hydrolase family protein [Sphingomonas jaspsi]|uniref:metal-dependent hydrolase family protein n=1 Tax=Sphingomonas jaspsi TaxID=392409 RepID=UPI0004B59A6E|nr:amidohydrolase family protein [Sphingomonas jaspsi]
MKKLMLLAAMLMSSAAQAETYAIQAGHLIVDAAKPARGASTVIVENGRIKAIEDGATAPAGATVVDLRDRTVMPGMTDVHVHLSFDAGQPWYTGFTPKYSESYAAVTGLSNALKMARAGFTTVRDLGGPLYGSLATRDASRDGTFPGPRIQVAGPALSIIGGHGDDSVGLNPELAEAVNERGQIGVCTGTDECSRAVRKIAAAGVDVIKFHATGGVLDPGAMGLEQHFSDAEMKAIVDTAHSLHLKTAAHAHGARGIEAAVRAGVDSIEHGTFVDDAGIRAMKEHGTYYSATLMALSGLNRNIGKGIYAANSEAKGRQALAAWGQGLSRAYKAGVKIALGTDAAVFPHAEAGQEVGLMVSKGGMTPRDALIAATKGGPDLMGLSGETGTLEPGKSADLIAVDGDPLTDPAAVTRVNYVMVMGKPIPMK